MHIIKCCGIKSCDGTAKLSVGSKNKTSNNIVHPTSSSTKNNAVTVESGGKILEVGGTTSGGIQKITQITDIGSISGATINTIEVSWNGGLSTSIEPVTNADGSVVEPSTKSSTLQQVGGLTSTGVAVPGETALQKETSSIIGTISQVEISISTSKQLALTTNSITTNSGGTTAAQPAAGGLVLSTTTATGTSSAVGATTKALTITTTPAGATKQANTATTIKGVAASLTSTAILTSINKGTSVTSTLKQITTTTTRPTSTSTSTTTTTTATTTTLRPPCLPYGCSVNTENLNSNGIVDTTKLVDAKSQQACDRLYVFSKALQNWTSAASYCCSLGMQMLSIETKEELICLSDLINSIDGAGLPGEYFTSGSDYQISNKFVWCTSNFTSLGTNIYWSTGEPSFTSFQGAEEDCVSIQLNTGQPKRITLKDVECTARKYVICEVPVPTTTKPPCLAYTCAKDTTILDADDLILSNVSLPGFLRIACGRMYFFSTAATDWATGAMECCKMNMYLVALETAAEKACLDSIFTIKNYGVGLNINFWTGLSDQNHEGLFTWCTSPRGGSVVNSQFFPSPQPDNAGGGENCAHAYFPNNGPVSNYNDAPCTANARYVCETAAPDCSFPQCPQYTCTRDSAKVALSKAWKSGPNGIFRSSCGQQYFFSTAIVTFADALAECCKYGLKLASFESKEEIDCIFDTYSAEIRISSGYWTSGTSAGFGCEFTHGWCGSNKLAQNLTWSSSEPSDPLVERCLEYISSTGTFNDLPCAANRSFICEGNIPECTPSCPATCEKNLALFNSENRLIKVATYGTWYTTADTTYLFGSSNVTFAQAHSVCCSIGMKLVSIDTVEKMESLIQTKNFIFIRLRSRPYLQTPDQTCVEFVSTSATTGYFNDVKCSDLYYYICEAPAEPTCNSVACRDVKCDVDPTKYLQSIAWKDSSVGDFRSVCGRQYYLHRVAASFVK
ncbi:Hypothetical predicted protein [Cloeon dipterum]|uniref:C-type lectin domain-containing protein n=1 Tax=Cloeon dipterum TaxID=197152 RepID=A0A8S1CN09_9INSE|nr:Hypothetical predicted protein [Cloeon dipterum]